MNAGTAHVPMTSSLLRVSGPQELTQDDVIIVRGTGLSKRRVGDIAEDVSCLAGSPCDSVPTSVGGAVGNASVSASLEVVVPVTANECAAGGETPLECTPAVDDGCVGD